MTSCFDLNLLHETSQHDNFVQHEYDLQSWKTIMGFGKIQEEQQHIIIEQ